MTAGHLMVTSYVDGKGSGTFPMRELINVLALLWYLQYTDGLLDPRGSLSSAVSRPAIAHANQGAGSRGVDVRKSGKCGTYNRYSLGDHAAIRGYAS